MRIKGEEEIEAETQARTLKISEAQTLKVSETFRVLKPVASTHPAKL